ncbi:hypothetical protein ACFSCX_17625 [Bacillus salitolerans]|uniref:Uncharacterized protein n=1 Tax=Bacillus salitolerans TaxID=1437434 RepID=A0ABW4LTE2_9BACI
MKNKKLTIKSISYVHDPEAAKKWFDLYLNLVKEKLIQESSKSVD